MTMKRKRNAPKPLSNIEGAAMDIVIEQDKADTESEDPAAAEWSAFAQDHYELVEQLPLSIHRSYSLMRELDDLAQDNTTRILPATRAYIALRDSLSAKPRGHRRAPSGLDLLAHVSAVVEPPAVSTPVPSLTNGVPETPQPLVNGQVNGHVENDKPPEGEGRDALPTSGVDPTAVSPGPGHTNPLPSDTPPPTVDPNSSANPEQPGTNPICANPASDNFPHDTRKLLTLIATLASDAVRASSEKLGIANAVYNSVDNHLTALNALIAQHKSTLPHPPTPTPPPVESPEPIPVSSPSIKLRPRRSSTQAKQQDDLDGAEEGQGTIPPLKITRTPTTIRIRNKSKGKEEPRQRGVSISGSASNQTSNSKAGATSRAPKIPPPTPRKATGAGAVNNKPPGNKNASKKTATDEVYCFHLPCVNLKVAPADNESWFCSDCKKAGIAAAPLPKKRRRR
ncbi:hypothetical protein BN14_08698 [Rhizoctonia solani AG-1 IB]|uniref:Inhibitor of growth protein N-terminal histone-binding domain-containing protein n=1 Tax=Thanatephorus cucumeris (strain AG1-IB / isolate 7/3/14) TaxID=1108050 RepID=M5C5L8_THACB|nr:hypothetical protein BN14_08698 [Rhizoctonia solani AG-1 IB]